MFRKAFYSYYLLRLYFVLSTVLNIFNELSDLPPTIGRYFLFISVLQINLEMVRLSNSHSQNSHYQLQSLNFGKYKYNVSPNKKISAYIKLKQIPSIQGLYCLKNKHFRGIYLELLKILFSGLCFCFFLVLFYF